MKKHPQFIVAAESLALTATFNLQQGMNRVSLTDFCQNAQSAIAIREREWLEQDRYYRQLLPYVVVSQKCGDETRYITYRRSKGAGESRLVGNVSIGFGGHIDLVDVAFNENSVIDLYQTIGVAATREIAEELKFSDGQEEKNFNLFDVGLIADNSNDVGKVHLGIVLAAMIPEHMTVETREAELEMLPPMTAQELLDSDLPLENWTRIFLEYVVSQPEVA